ncbi:hypothetical protein [Clostridioides difficile]|uniref:hypothetical protein n=1 Tax=Clostridioides difficile TaxID=1496 RepID=UPI003786F96D
MNNKKSKWISIPFVVIIIGIFLIHIVSKDKEISASENRTLAQNQLYKILNLKNIQANLKVIFQTSFHLEKTYLKYTLRYK